MDDTRRRDGIQKAKATAERSEESGRAGDRYSTVGIIGSLVVVLLLVVGILQIIVRVSENTSNVALLKRELPSLRAQVTQLEDENSLLRQNLGTVSQQLEDRGITPNVSFPPDLANPSATTTTIQPPTTPTTIPPTPTPTTPPTTAPPAPPTTAAPPPPTATTTTTAPCLLSILRRCP